MIQEPVDDGTPAPPLPRYRIRAAGFGWEVCDTESGVPGQFRGWARVDYVSDRDAGGWTAAQHLAQERADQLNAE